MLKNINEQLLSKISDYKLNNKTSDISDYSNSNFALSYVNFLEQKEKVTNTFSEMIKIRNCLNKNVLVSLIYLYYLGLANDKMENNKMFYKLVSNQNLSAMIDRIHLFVNAKLNGINISEELEEEENNITNKQNYLLRNLFNQNNNSTIQISDYLSTNNYNPDYRTWFIRTKPYLQFANYEKYYYLQTKKIKPVLNSYSTSSYDIILKTENDDENKQNDNENATLKYAKKILVSVPFLQIYDMSFRYAEQTTQNEDGTSTITAKKYICYENEDIFLTFKQSDQDVAYYIPNLKFDNLILTIKSEEYQLVDDPASNTFDCKLFYEKYKFTINEQTDIKVDGEIKFYMNDSTQYYFLNGILYYNSVDNFYKTYNGFINIESHSNENLTPALTKIPMVFKYKKAPLIDTIEDLYFNLTGEYLNQTSKDQLENVDNGFVYLHEFIPVFNSSISSAFLDSKNIFLLEGLISSTKNILKESLISSLELLFKLLARNIAETIKDGFEAIADFLFPKRNENDEELEQEPTIDIDIDLPTNAFIKFYNFFCFGENVYIDSIIFLEKIKSLIDEIPAMTADIVDSYYTNLYKSNYENILNQFYLDMEDIDDILSSLNFAINNVSNFLDENETNYLEIVLTHITNYNTKIESDAIQNINTEQMLENKFKYFSEMINTISLYLFDFYSQSFESLSLLENRIKQTYLFIKTDIESENSITSIVQQLSNLRSIDTVDLFSYQNKTFYPLQLFNYSFEAWYRKFMDYIILDNVTYAILFALGSVKNYKGVNSINVNTNIQGKISSYYNNILSDIIYNKSVFWDVINETEYKKYQLSLKNVSEYDFMENINNINYPELSNKIQNKVFEEFCSYNINKIFNDALNSLNLENINDVSVFEALEKELSKLKILIYKHALKLERDQIFSLFSFNTLTKNNIKQDLFFYLLYLVDKELDSENIVNKEGEKVFSSSITEASLFELKNRIYNYSYIYASLYRDIEIEKILDSNQLKTKDIIELLGMEIIL